MKNPLYAELCAKHKEAVQAANTAKGDLRFQVEGFQKIIRGHEENIRALLRERDFLRAESQALFTENQELRRRLGLSETEPVITKENEEESHHD